MDVTYILPSHIETITQGYVDNPNAFETITLARKQLSSDLCSRGTAIGNRKKRSSDEECPDCRDYIDQDAVKQAMEANNA